MCQNLCIHVCQNLCIHVAHIQLCKHVAHMELCIHVAHIEHDFLLCEVIMAHMRACVMLLD